jgi:hypothetical protein
MHAHLTYATLAGHRRLRRYVIATALILVVIGLLFGWVGWQRVQVWAESSGSETAPKYETPWLAAASKSEKSASIPEEEVCPSDPESWALLDVYPGDNYKRIEPDCVYEGLAKTVTWHMLERLGYTKSEAADLLGFQALPWHPSQSIKGLTNTQGPMMIPLDMEWAPHPAYRTWAVSTEGQPALAHSLRGCYRTRTIVGNDLISWGRYPVICVLAYDRDPGWTVTELGEQRFTVDLTTAPPLRRFILFGYAGETWVLLGEWRGQQMVIAGPSAAKQEREQVAARYGVVSWDLVWLEATFGLGMRPLPEGWQSFGADSDAIQSIANQLDDVLQEVGGSP